MNLSSAGRFGTEIHALSGVTESGYWQAARWMTFSLLTSPFISAQWMDGWVSKDLGCCQYTSLYPPGAEETTSRKEYSI